MPRAIIQLGDQRIAIDVPDLLWEDIKISFGHHLQDASSEPLSKQVLVTSDRDNFFTVADAHGSSEGVPRADVTSLVMDAVITALIEDVSSSIVLHAGAVALQTNAAVIVGPTGAGKSSLVAWLVDRGFQYLTDEIVLASDDTAISGFSRALVMKPGSYELVRRLPNLAGAKVIPAGSNHLVRPASPDQAHGLRCALLLFVKFSAGSDLEVRLGSRAGVASALVEANLNARNLADGGFVSLTALARRIPGIFLTYGHFDQLADRLGPLLRKSLEKQYAPESYGELLASL